MSFVMQVCQNRCRSLCKQWTQRLFVWQIVWRNLIALLFVCQSRGPLSHVYSFINPGTCTRQIVITVLQLKHTLTIFVVFIICDFDCKQSCCWNACRRVKRSKTKQNPCRQIFFSDGCVFFCVCVYSNSLNYRNFGCIRPIRFRSNLTIRHRRKLNLSRWRTSRRFAVVCKHAMHFA